MVTIGNQYSSNSPILSEPLSRGSPRTEWKYHYFPPAGHGDIGYQPILSVEYGYWKNIRPLFRSSLLGSKSNVLEILISIFQSSNACTTFIYLNMWAYLKAHTYINQSWYNEEIIGYNHIVYFRIHNVKYNKLWFYCFISFFNFLYYNSNWGVMKWIRCKKY